MTYRELQLALKPFKAAGKTTIKLNGKKATLQAEYERLTAGAMVVTVKPEPKAATTVEGRQARINGLLEQLKANQQAELANAANIYAVATVLVKKAG